MGYPDYKQPFVLHTDASLDGLGAVLYQKQDGRMRVIIIIIINIIDIPRTGFSITIYKDDLLYYNKKKTKKQTIYIVSYPKNCYLYLVR